MKRQLTRALLLFVITGLAAWAQSQKNDWLVVPGQRIGPIKAGTTRSDLDSIFGSQNVHDQEVERGEEGPEPATVVFPGRRLQALAIFWENDKIFDVEICYLPRSSGCLWHTPNGVTLGTSVVQLEQLNGRPFQIEPWGTDGGGIITSWRDGKLRPSFGDNGKYLLAVGVYWKESPSGPNSQQLKWIKKLDLVRGQLTSATPELRHLRPSVTEMTLFFH